MKAVGIAIKVLILIAIIMAGVFGYQQCSGQSCIIQRIDKMPPDAMKAPYQVTTKTHVYLCEKAEPLTNGDVIITGWYENIEDKWVLNTGSITLTKKVYGNIQVVRR